jgi:hypothetical protein
MLLSHKLCRWLVHLTLPLALAGLGMLAMVEPVAMALLIGVIVIGAVGGIALRWPAARRMPYLVAVSGFLVAVNLAALLAWTKALRGERNPIWEPTRRPNAAGAGSPT